MGRFVGGTMEGGLVRAQPTEKRPVAGPTIKTERDYRVARDALMKVARDAGFNRFDLEILFGVSPNHTHKRLRRLKAAAQRSQRYGL